MTEKPAKPDVGMPTGPTIANDGKLDPHKLDVAAKPKRKRRARNRPAPDPELQAWGKTAEARLYSRPIPPGIILEPAGVRGEHWTSPHNDVALWQAQLADALGTRSRAVVITFMAQLQALCGESHWDDEARHQALAKIQAEAIKTSRWVGDKFADQSRAMHYGDADHATIHGQATREEARDLLDEGIMVAPLLIPIAPPDEIN